MDALSEVLYRAHLEGVVYQCGDFCAPWRIAWPIPGTRCTAFLRRARRIVPYYLVIQGSCWLCPVDDPAAVVRVHAGEFVVVPSGEAHLVGSSPEAVQGSAESLPIFRGATSGEPIKLGHSGRTARTRLICGFFACHDTPMNPVLLGLPCVFKADLLNDPHSPWLEWTLGLAAAEATEWSAASAVRLARLSELLLVLAIRRYIEALPDDRKGWLAGVGDRFIRGALATLHGSPERDWTVEQLAQKTGLSPAAFLQRFTRLLGEPPLQYLSRLRAEIAAQKLANDTISTVRHNAERL